jgi:hypothetical protein
MESKSRNKRNPSQKSKNPSHTQMHHTRILKCSRRGSGRDSQWWRRPTVVVTTGLEVPLAATAEYETPDAASGQHLFITSTSLRHTLGTSPSGLNQTEIKRLTVTPCKRGELHIRRQLERRKSASPPIRRCRSRSPALCQSH